ncbi:hypothetical protein DFS34DRAFT_650191 [Phlyctochytrium arcticum]|nr:hypothetical protein DFS34DRAFT_650191 [Phlyctochytrium arcticum]
MLEIHYRQLNIKPHLFGSSVNGLGFAWSDVDVTFEIMSPEQYDKDEMDEWTSMHRLARALRNWGMKKVLPIPGARVQICKFFDPSTRMHCDANFGNLLGVHNSHLLATYCALDRRVKPLIMLLKLWAVNRDLNDPSGGGTISSYAYALMMINFLQIRGILPSLQALYDGQERVLLNVPKPKPRMNQYRDRRRAVKEERQQRRDQERIEKDKEDMADGDYDNLYEKGEEVEALIPPPKNIVHTADVTFLRDFSHASLLPYKERFEASTSYDVWSGPVGVAALFYQFLHYHAWEFIYRPNHVVSVRTGTVLSETPATLSEWKRKLGLILVVEDPFQLSHNTTGGVRDPSKVILEMRRALVLMQKAERDGCDAQEIMRRVLEETKEVSAKADANKEVLHQKLEELWSIDLRNGNVKKTSRSASARSKAPPSGSLRGSRDVSMGKRSTDVKSTVARETSFVDSRRDGKSSEFDLRKDATRIRDDRKPAVNGKSSEVDLPRNATRIRDNFKTEVHGVRAVAVDQSSRPSSSSTGTPKSKSGTSSKKNWRDNHEEAASVDKLTRSMSALRVENHESREDVGRELMVEINGATRAIRRRSAKPLQNPGPAPRSPEPTIRYELNGLYMSPRSTEGDGLPRDRSLRKSKSAQIHAQRGSGVFPATDWRYGADTPTATIHAQRVSPATDWKYGADTPTATGQQQQYTRICRKCRKSGHIARECTYVGG